MSPLSGTEEFCVATPVLRQGTDLSVLQTPENDAASAAEGRFSQLPHWL
jgi:hypothetical protein